MYQLRVVVYMICRHDQLILLQLSLHGYDDVTWLLEIDIKPQMKVIIFC